MREAVDLATDSSEKQAPAPNRNLLVKSAVLIVLIILLSVIITFSAGVFFVGNAQNVDSVYASDVRLTAGPDCLCNPANFPCANVSIAPTYDYATITLSLFPSANNNPQPLTYCTNLLQIRNFGDANCTIKGITVSNIKGASNLGCLTVFLFSNQTDSPTTCKPLGSISLTNSSSGSISLCDKYVLEASQVNYIEIVGCAAAGCACGSTVGFTVNLQYEGV
jgi:hypothetical protein